MPKHDYNSIKWYNLLQFITSASEDVSAAYQVISECTLAESVELDNLQSHWSVLYRIVEYLYNSLKVLSI